MAHVALETGFPAGVVSVAAEKEAWRKEVHRPATHTHKWWAQRLGSVFRGIIVSALADSEAAAAKLYGSVVDRPDVVVFDPFAGSGTTLVEAAKMGCRVIGYDINPVATLVQRQAMADWDSHALNMAYKEVEGKVRPEIDRLHVNARGETVLYYFWVGVAPCPSCPVDDHDVELFKSYVFARHAYPKKYPTAQATCPDCHAVNVVNLTTDTEFTCSSCDRSGSFDGPVRGASMRCSRGHVTKVISALDGNPPKQKMYAKLVLGKDGKRYEPIDSFDLELYAESEALLEEKREELVGPIGTLDAGNNTRQAIRWGYTTWPQFFNARQLYCLGLLGAAIRNQEASPEREALVALFSGVLEFNNLFCSYKGEGTGAVRHMFSNHILKPERTPLEAHPWGTPASSGSFSTLFKSRILRALEYKKAPHDIVDGERVVGISKTLGSRIVDSYEQFEGEPAAALIVTGSSADTALPDSSVDLVITDPPYFDNVHYSELADFFHAWLRQMYPFPAYPSNETTRMVGEVQSTDADKFSAAIAQVWREAARVMKEDGLLAFTFHQARAAGWEAVVKALKQAGLIITAVQPVKGEMSVAAPKSAATDPSNLDSIVVCRKATSSARPTLERVINELRECKNAGVTVGWTDVQSVVRGAVLAAYTDPASKETLTQLMSRAAAEADEACIALGVTSRRAGSQVDDEAPTR
ncbi:SAM-dependent methyltransferase [Amycolatopsis sp. WAC 04197]|uniref:DNA methyltransferase n=1 Tax=Amycolatopsis sp. WAC 04197 TaxID=2203199 RepID=UPI000F774301|nr:DNA methyltransferase [Amycolatopsis sp. WAC 04197]RSN47290.1 SAM-dependent methyltransferase [Amycolatopsis sp. WAC 04197]